MEHSGGTAPASGSVTGSERAGSVIAMEVIDRLRGGVYGLLVGDALGVPYEFHRASAIPPVAGIEMTPPSGFPRAHGTVPPGTWSDDGAQALVLLESLLRVGHLHVGDLGSGLLRWRDEGRYAVDGRVFDIGIQTESALERIAAGEPARTAGASHERANGNGSLMRILPLALWHQGTDAELVADAMLSSRPTHGHLRSLVCCALYCLWARRTRDGMPPRPAWTAALAAFDTLYRPGTPEQAERAAILPEPVPTRAVTQSAVAVRGTGYVVDSLRAAIHLCAHDLPLDYETVVKGAIALGDDTDTTACIAGGIAGIVVGESGIPVRWRAQLRGRELVEPLLDALVAVVSPRSSPGSPK